MPPKKTVRKTIKNAPKAPSPLKEYMRVLNTVRATPQYKNKSYREQQQIAKKIYQKL